MKKALFLLAVSAALLASCDKDSGGSIPERKDIVLTRSEAEVMTSGNAFSFNLFRKVASEKDYGSVFISPLSVHIANCMLANGAGGETYSQIVKTLGYEGFPIGDVNSAYKTLVEGLKKVDTSTELDIASAVWINKGFPVSKDYVSTMSDVYDAHVANLDFSSSSSVKTINDWCSQKTHKMIPKIVDDFEGDDVMLLMNALYFKGKWKEKFDKSNTRKDTFKTLGGGAISKEFMNITKTFTYAETSDEKIRLCELPYGNGAFVMDIILPDEDVDFKEFVAGMTGERWSNMFTYRRDHNIQLSLPKFKFEGSYDLTETLKSLGMELPYDRANADLTKMCSSSSWQLWVDKTIQKTAIDVDEDGTKAAAVTTHHIKGDTSPGPVETVVFNCDHPFMYLIRETTSGAILFIGTFTA